MKKKILLALVTVSVLALSGCGNLRRAGAEAVPSETAETVETSGTDGRTESAGAVTAVATDAAVLTVSATSEIKGEPDMAKLTLAIETSDVTVADAQKQNAEETDRVLAALSEQGIEESSIQTSGYSVYPWYDDYGESIISYRVETTLTVSDVPISNVSSVLTVCGEAGITDVWDIQYFFSGYDEAYEQALQQAVAAAEEKAQVLAEFAGKSLAGVTEITEGYQDLSLRYTSDNGMAKYAATEEMDAGGDATIMPGEVTVRAEVTVTYAMK